MAVSKVYKARQFNLSGLSGISDQTLEMHFKLYEGYVANTNTLNEKIGSLIGAGSISDMTTYSELTRRLGFEYNVMVLHEYYFENMKRGGAGHPTSNSSFLKAGEQRFGRYGVWKTDFVGVGKMRGVVCAICNQNPANDRLSNHWVSEHQVGNVA